MMHLYLYAKQDFGYKRYAGFRLANVIMTSSDTKLPMFTVLDKQYHYCRHFRHLYSCKRALANCSPENTKFVGVSVIIHRIMSFVT
jgi:hypothetical protein